MVRIQTCYTASIQVQVKHAVPGELEVSLGLLHGNAAANQESEACDRGYYCAESAIRIVYCCPNVSCSS